MANLKPMHSARKTNSSQMSLLWVRHRPSPCRSEASTYDSGLGVTSQHKAGLGVTSQHKVLQNFKLLQNYEGASLAAALGTAHPGIKLEYI